MRYAPTPVAREIVVQELYTIHYLEYYAGYRFQGESHPFWEFIYADRGEMTVTAGEERYPLRQGQIFFHPPGQFHAVEADANRAANAIVISFSCSSPVLASLAGGPRSIGVTQRQLLSSIITEAREAYANDLGDPGFLKLIPSGGGEFGAEEYIVLLLETFLIQMLRLTQLKAPRPWEQRDRDLGVEYFTPAAQYIERHMDAYLSLEILSACAGVSPAHLERLCRRATGKSVAAYCRERRVERARELIREGRMSMTAIAAATGFSSVHYFSRTFRALVGMSPREYLRSVQSMTVLPPQERPDS
ncbi:MAG: AraC family transcriptional regulator [Eubacteriales bacterium]|nr:AraC family transcriptional regulator [Eubacteriales bacterium]